MHNMHDLGMRLREIRQSKKLNQRQLADLVGVDQATIQRAEKMHKSARLETYALCAQALGVSLADLFVEERTAKENALIEMFRQSDERVQRWLLALADEAPSLPTAPDTGSN